MHFRVDGYGALLGNVYSKARGLEWQIKELKNWYINYLPVGTKIYITDTPAYIIVIDGKEVPYLEKGSF